MWRGQAGAGTRSGGASSPALNLLPRLDLKVALPEGTYEGRLRNLQGLLGSLIRRLRNRTVP